MIHLSINRSRTGSLFVIAETTSPGANYTMPPVTRSRVNFPADWSVSECFEKLGEWVANELERRA